MAFKKVEGTVDEFLETSEPKIRKVKLSDLRAELQKNKQKISDVNERIEYFTDLFAQSKYPEDVRHFINILENEKEMNTESIPEQETFIAKLEKM